jgi:hypothetical protein
MTRPERQLTHLEQKTAAKIGRSHKKPGKRAKRWKAATAKYTALVATLTGASS